MVCSLAAMAQPSKAADKAWSTGKITTAEDGAEIQFALEPKGVQPGGTAKLSITLTPQDPWYLYERSPDGERKASNGLPVLVHLDKPNFGTLKGPVPSLEGQEKVYSDGSKANVYNEAVTFVYEITIPAEQPEGELELAGGVGVQTCSSRDQIFRVMKS